MKNNEYPLRTSQRLTKGFSPEEIRALGKKLLEGIDEDGASNILIQFLAECFIYQKQHYLPKPLLQYLKDNPDEFERVIACTETFAQPKTTSTRRIPLYTRIAAILLFVVGLFFLWRIYFDNNDKPSSKNKISGSKVEADTLKKDNLEKPLITNRPKKKEPSSSEGDSTKGSLPNQNQNTNNVAPSSQSEFEKYIAMKSQFEDIGVRLQYTIGKVENRVGTRTIIDDDSSKKITVPLMVQTPSMVIWQPLKKNIQFIIKAKAPLPDTTQMFIQIENHEREPVKLIPLKKVALQQWQCVWLTAQPGLYYWQFKRSKTDDPQPTGKIYVGDKRLIEKLYVKFPGLSGG